MAVDALVETLVSLDNAVDITTRIQLLQRLKSEAIGHVEKKELLVVHGILDILARLLQSQAKSRGKQPSQSNGVQNVHSNKPPRPWTQENELTLNAILLLITLANQGPAFVAPMLAANIIPLLVSLISPAESNSSKITVAALKCLYAVAAASRSTNPTSESFSTSPASDVLYSTSTIHDFALILADKSHAPVVQTKLLLVYQLIALTCNTDHRRGMLLDGGILDLLAARLAAYRTYETSSPLKSANIPAASLLPPTSVSLGHIFGALVSIIDNSQYRAVRLLFSPTVVGCFPILKANNPYDHSVAAQNYNALESLLPRLQNQKPDSTSSKAFPLLGAVDSARDLAGSFPTAQSRQSNQAWTLEYETAMIPWLFHIVKSYKGLTRVQAANLLAEFNRTDLLSPHRERPLSLLVVPILANSDETLAPYDSEDSFGDSSVDRRQAKELSRFVLAKLIPQRESLQNSATDACCMKQVCQTMKDSFEPIQTLAPVWSPTNATAGPSESSPQELPPSRTLGMSGLRPELASMYKEREGALLLLAAVSASQDTNKKYFTDNGMTQCIIDSMKPFDQNALLAAEKSDSGARGKKIQVAEFGNPDAVLIAACNAAQSLSRSVALMRTSLIDGGIVKPTLALLKHPNVEVLKAATDVVCNIDVEFSPMRQELLEAGATKILCEHAHSADSEIRLRSLWALKHLVLQAPYEIKTSCLEELGTGWLVQIVSGGVGARSTDQPLQGSSSSSITAANAAGEQIDILNASEISMTDSQDTHTGDTLGSSSRTSGEDLAMKLIMPSHDPSHDPGYLLALTHEQREIRIIALADARVRQSWGPKLIEEKIQVQGLDFIRNSMLVPANQEMVDYYFQTLGASCVFDIIAEKLKSSPAIKQSAIMILVHIAASEHRHRQQIISQPTILQQLLPLMSHPCPTIRRAICFFVNNLTWTDDTGDIPPATSRALELRKLGFEEALKAMRHDERVDIKERAKTALEQMSNLLDGANGDASGSTR